MSVIQSQSEQQGQSDNQPCAAIDLLIRPGKKDLGGFSVRRCLPWPQRRLVGPWIFFDHAGPGDFAPGEGVDVRPHPHINLATVTYFFEGQFLHQDSLGNRQVIQPGDINLMVAGSGIVHSERTPADLRATGSRINALQLWLALPEADEETAPAFYHYERDAIPEVVIDGVQVRVMMGTAFSVTSPVKTFAETVYFEALIPAGASLDLPEIEERALYVVEGELNLDGETVPQHSMAVLTRKQGLRIRASKASRVALIGGEQLGPRHIWWNFVSSRKQRIEQAKKDWREGRFPRVPGDEDEYIPLPED